MKKIFSKILIAILILGFFFAPVTPKIDIQNHFSLVKNEAKAEATIAVKSSNVSGNSATFSFTINNTENGYLNDEIIIEIGKPNAILSGSKKIKIKNNTQTQTINVEFSGLELGTDYEVKAYLLKGTKTIKNQFNIKTASTANGTGTSGNSVDTSKDSLDTSNPLGSATGYDNPLSDGREDFFNCGVTNPIQCFMAILYLIWSAIAWIATLSAQVLDFFIFYSLKNTSYETEFVTSGWAVVRDIANLFFIIALLYVAGKTVLGLNSSNNKKVITMVIVMALLINFSLFISKVVIDASNILARVFYESIENVNQNNQTNTVGDEGEKQITVGLVKTFDPQKLFINSGVKNIDNHTDTFLILMLISGALMVYMIITFLSIAFLFVGRVVGLWILMVFAPLAFASYTMPSFKIPKFGNQEWWSSLFNLSFSAPIFIFFLYLIISFGDAFKIVEYGSDGTAFVNGTAAVGDVDTMKTYLSVIIPFALIYVLLKQAKKTTTEMAGDIAQGVNTAGKALVGATVGLAAAGTAMIGRQTIGATAKYAMNDTARGKDKDITARMGDLKGSAALNPLNYAKIIGKGLAAKTAEFVTTRKRYADGTIKGDLYASKKLGGIQNNKAGRTWIGRQIVASQASSKDLSHAKHVLDHGADEIEKGSTYASLTEPQQAKVRENVNREELAKKIFGVKFAEIKDDVLKADLKQKVSDYHKNGEKGALTYNYNGTTYSPEHDAKHMAATLSNQNTNSSAAVNEFVNALRKGSFDIRGLADAKFNNGKGLLGSFSKNSVFLAATIAAGLRMGLKNIGDVNTGKPQKDFTKDLSNVITSALKGIKLDIKSSGGGGGGHDSHGGGGHDDHGGGHGGGHH